MSNQNHDVYRNHNDYVPIKHDVYVNHNDYEPTTMIFMAATMITNQQPWYLWQTQWL